MKESQRYLDRIRMLDLLIINKLAEKARWFEIATSTTANMSGGDRVKSSSDPHRMESAVCDYIEAGREYDEFVSKCKAERDEIIRTIEMLPPTEYDLLHKVYVQYKSLKEVAVLKRKAYSWATTVHGTALKHVQDILDARKKS
jgi:hypothetical protein